MRQLFRHPAAFVGYRSFSVVIPLGPVRRMNTAEQLNSYSGILSDPLQQDFTS
jgi:hypothetical protein